MVERRGKGSRTPTTWHECHPLHKPTGRAGSFLLPKIIAKEDNSENIEQQVSIKREEEKKKKRAKRRRSRTIPPLLICSLASAYFLNPCFRFFFAGRLEFAARDHWRQNPVSYRMIPDRTPSFETIISFFFLSTLLTTKLHTRTYCSELSLITYFYSPGPKETYQSLYRIGIFILEPCNWCMYVPLLCWKNKSLERFAFHSRSLAWHLTGTYYVSVMKGPTING